MKPSFLLFLLIILAEFIYSQTLISEKITSDNGLPSSEIYSLLQDNKGFIWLATDNGLTRYDGKKFQTYTTEEGLPESCILRIHKDQEGNIWFVSLSHKMGYIDEQGLMHKYNYTIPSISKAPFDLIIDKTNVKWILDGRKRALFIEGKKNSFEFYGPGREKKEKFFSYLITPITKKFIAGQCLYTDNFLKDFEVQKKESSLLISGPFFDYFDNEINGEERMNFYPRLNGGILGVHQNGFYIEIRKDSVLRYGNLGVKGILKAYEDRDTNLWLATSNGAFFYEKGNLNTPVQFFKNRFIANIIQDNEGNYWFADHDLGLHKVSSIHFRLFRGAKPSIDDKIASLKLRNNQLWYATIKGEIVKIGQDLKAEHVFSDTRRPYDFYAFEVLPDGRLFLPGALIPFTKEKENTASYNYQEYKSIDLVDGKIYVGGTKGFLIYDSTGRLIYQSLKPQKKSSFFKDRINALLKEDKNLWIGSAKGLFLRESDTITKVRKDYPLLSMRIMSIKPYGAKHLIIGTKGAGILFFNKATHEVKQVTKKDGLLSNTIKSILSIKEKIYIGTNRGLSIVNMDRNMSVKHIQNYTVHNALPSSEVADMISFAGYVWLATNKGIVYFKEERLTTNDVPPPITLTQLNANDTLIDISRGVVELSALQRNLLFSYNGVGFRAGPRIRYRYFLSGFDTDTTITSSAEVRYTNLPCGNLTFYVWAENEDGYWSTEPAKLSIFIPPKFSETLWFPFLISVILIGAFISFSYLIYRRKQNQLQVDLQASELKQQALAALMNPHFIHNSLAAIQYFIYNGENEKSSVYLSYFARLVRKNLSSIRKGFISLEEEIERLQTYLEIEKLRFGEKLSYHLKVEENLDLSGIKIPSMIIQPFVENAIWHGILPLKEAGEINLTFNMVKEDILVVEVEDNGTGISQNRSNKDNQHHTSLSLEITQERLALLGKQTGKQYVVEIREADGIKGGGTIAHLRIPIV